MNDYQAWIDTNVTETYGTCREVTERMAAAFPELTRVRGLLHESLVILCLEEVAKL